MERLTKEEKQQIEDLNYIDELFNELVKRGVKQVFDGLLEVKPMEKKVYTTTTIQNENISNFNINSVDENGIKVLSSYWVDSKILEENPWIKEVLAKQVENESK